MKITCAIFIALALIVLSVSAADEGSSCGTDSQCDSHLACQDRRCKNPCKEGSRCAPNTDCTVANHRAICSCKKGYEGHAHTECRKIDSCTHNAECDTHLSCRHGKCVNACSEQRCAGKCKVTSHVPFCE